MTFPLCLVLGFGVPAAVVIAMAGAPWFAWVLLCAVIALAGFIEELFEGLLLGEQVPEGEERG